MAIVMQLAFVRPFLMFIAAVAWTDGKYVAGSVCTLSLVYLYIQDLCLDESLWSVAVHHPDQHGVHVDCYVGPERHEEPPASVFEAAPRLS